MQAPAIAPAAAAVTPLTKSATTGRPAIRLNAGSSNTVSRNAGRKTPRVAAAAPPMPATRYPMNPTTITTGPGVIMATAMASRNCGSVSQPRSVTTPE